MKIVNPVVDKNDPDKLYKSNKDGLFKIVKDLGREERHVRKYLIEFIDTGNQTEAFEDHIKTGSVSDIERRMAKIGNIYPTKRNGDIEVIGVDESKVPTQRTKVYFMVKFLNTGAIRSARNDHILSGNVIDQTVPQIAGIGVYGDIKLPHEVVKHEYNIWLSMLYRCHKPSDSNYHLYGALGIEVCMRWRNFTTFYYDLPYLPNYQNMKNNPNIPYNLDKDYKQLNYPKNITRYSPETCMWIKDSENTKLGLLTRDTNYIPVAIIDVDSYYDVLYKMNNLIYSYCKTTDFNQAQLAYAKLANYFGVNQMNINKRTQPDLYLSDEWKQYKERKVMCRIID